MLDFIHDDIFNVDCDLLVIPISTEGAISSSFRKGLEAFYPEEKRESKKYQLGEIEVVRSRKNGRIIYIALACTVENDRSSYWAIFRIGKLLIQKVFEIGGIRIVAAPLLGTGAGKLNPYLSMNILLNSFFEDQPIFNIVLTICSPEHHVYNTLNERALDTHTASALLVIKAETSSISKNDLISELQSMPEFYYELAVNKYQEFIDFKAPSENFFSNIEYKFRSYNISFKELFQYLKVDTPEYKFVILCGELIAYIDFHAYGKNTWNQYKDKRVLARSSVRQNNWFENLLRYKQNSNPSSLSASIRNALAYLKNPTDNITMLSEKHRTAVFKHLKIKSQDNELAIRALLKAFRKMGFTTKNPMNFSALCSRILYLPEIKPVWLDRKNKSEDSHDIIDPGIHDLDLNVAGNLISQCLSKKRPSLDLGNCGITDLSLLPELFECEHLEELILSNEWPMFLNGVWTKAKSSNRGKKNNLRYIPSDIKRLRNLKILICGGDWNDGKEKWNRWGISNLSSILPLTYLEHLNLSNNLLKNVSGLEKLKRLRLLHLNNNEITFVSDLSGMLSLREIYISNNHIENVEFLRYAKAIDTIDLHHNRITDLRPIKELIYTKDIVNDSWKVGAINVAKNPLTQPPMQIVNIGREAVIRTLTDIKKGSGYINEDLKVILVGNSETGKSTFVKYLDNETDLHKPHLPTLWMDEKTITSKYTITAIGKKCTLRIFDFGGHDYYHDTHHLFYSANTIYLLLWESKTNKFELRNCIQSGKNGEPVEIETQDYPIKYWLDSVKFYIKDAESDHIELESQRQDTYNSRLLLLQNKVASSSCATHLNNSGLQNDYPFIYDFLNISIIDPKRNLQNFDEVFEEILNEMPLAGAVLPSFYDEIKKSIDYYKGKPVINLTEFQSYCNSFLSHPVDKQQCQIAVEYLAQVGLLLFTKAGTDFKIYINKKWVIENIHKVLLDVVDKGGEFDRKYMKSTLQSSEESDIENILDMMLDFKMIFKHPYRDTYIAPLYLPKMPESKIKLFINDNIWPYRRFEYAGFIQKHLILSIFQQYGSLTSVSSTRDFSDSFYYWKDGLIIRNPDTFEIVMIKFHLGNADGNSCIDVYNISDKEEKSMFIHQVIEYIKEINRGHDYEEMVTINGIDFISLAVINKNAAHGRLIFSETRMKDFSRQKDEEKFYNLKDYKKHMSISIKRKKVVFSYSKEDIEHAHTLKRYLRTLVDLELIEEPWFCTDLRPGDEWKLEIQERFAQADIVLFLISDYFFNTPFIVSHEIPTIIDRYDSGQSVKIVPIILECYDWERKHPYNLQRFSALPYRAKAISEYKNPKIAWHSVTLLLRAMIEQDLDPGKIDITSRELQKVYERQVKGKLDNNSD